MEATLTSILKELKSVKETVLLSIQSYKDSLVDLDDTVLEINKEFSKSDKDVYELRRYKSSLLQIKTDLNNQLSESKNVLEDLQKSIEVFEKIVQLKTGDIF